MKKILPSALATLALFPVAVMAAADWLIDPAPFRASVTRSPRGDEVVLENGLLRRVIRLSPNAATVSLENLVTGAQIVRSVRPEAEVTIDGTVFPVGGLEGQPVHNYLDPRWLAKMTAVSGSYVFERLEIGETKPRFPWKKRLEWMAQDAPWPPPGKSLTLFFRPPDAPPAELSGPVLWEERCRGPLPSAWKVHASTSHPRASFANEGKVGEIMAVADTCVYAERRLPQGVATIEVTVDTGDDTAANSWGPGLALVADGQPVASLVMRPNSQQYEIVTAAGGERLAERFDRGKAATLRVRMEPGGARLEASQDKKHYLDLGRVTLAKNPDTLRVGKVGKGGNGRDYSPLKADPSVLPPRCHVLEVVVRGPEPAAKPAVRADLPSVEVHYEIFDGMPVLSKWLTLTNATAKPVRLNKFVAETLAVVEEESVVDEAAAWRPPDNLLVETDYTFGGMSAAGSRSPGVHWVADPRYPTQVNYACKTPCLLECRPPLGPDQTIAPGESFESFRVFELLRDSADRERRGLAFRRMYRALAPWVTENPVLMHVRGADPAAVKLAIDQCAEVGFEMVIMTFGSGFNFESRDPRYQAQIKELADYGRRKGVALGGYSLLASRGAATAADNTQGSPPRFGVMPCLGAAWGRDYLAQLRHFMEVAGLEVLEHDGSYPGDLCAATDHPHHRGLDDSQWVMWKAITGLYQWCRGQGISLNVPDWYFLNGVTKTGMGYRETNWSLPREYQEIIERQNVFDGTWEKTPSMGWMFVPLTQYHGGGAAATIEPLSEHLDHYGNRLANLFGAGVQACYRGPRLYDTEVTRALVKKWVDFYKAHRAILDGDIIHLRRADGRDLDSILHVNPRGAERGLLMVYNPCDEELSRVLTVPLYYTGLRGAARIRVGSEARAVALDERGNARIEVRVPARGNLALLVEAP